MGLGKPEDVGLDDFWVFCKNDGLGEAGDEISSEDIFIDLNRSLWFVLGRSMWKKHCNFFEENLYYIMNDIQKPFNVVILEYDERMREMFEIAKLLPPRIMNNYKYD